MKQFNQEKGDSVLEVLLLMLAIVLVFCILFTWKNAAERKPDPDLVRNCVAEIQQQEGWTQLPPAALKAEAMAYQPPAGISKNKEKLQNTRKACYNKLVTESANSSAD